MRSARSKGKKDPAYLKWLHTLKCVACSGGEIIVHQGFSVIQIQAHHAGTRGLSQRASDRTAIPLCRYHHDRTSPTSVHTLGKVFWNLYGLDKQDLIRRLNEQYDSIQQRRTA